MWHVSRESLTWTTEAPTGWNYKVADLESQTVVTLGHKGSFATGENAQVLYAPGPTGASITVSVNRASTIVNGNPSGMVLVASPVQNTAANARVVSRPTHPTLCTRSKQARPR